MARLLMLVLAVAWLLPATLDSGEKAGKKDKETILKTFAEEFITSRRHEALSGIVRQGLREGGYQSEAGAQGPLKARSALANTR